MEEVRNQTVERKHSHVELCLNADVSFSSRTNGLERIELVHNAAPELNFQDIDLSTTFLGQRIDYPFMISSMTGGYGHAEDLNRTIAETAARLNIPLGVGSMRQALENSDHQKSFSVVRQAAPDIPVYANIGAPEVAAGLTDEQLAALIGIIDANALIIHLNPAQELFQPEGSTNFQHLLREIDRTASRLPVPIIAKEVGCGISGSTARQLLDAGVTVIDVAGAGGLSWQKVEEERYRKQFSTDTRFSPQALEQLLEWGIPTATCLLDIAELKEEQPRYADAPVIASGGIKNGIDIAKSIALGANIAASAGMMLKALDQGKLQETILQWMNDLRAVMFLTGSPDIAALQQTTIRITNA